MDRISFHEAVERIRGGRVGVIPTDTLYGIVASVLRPDAVERVYGVRGRDEGKPCIVLLADMTDLGHFGIDPDDAERAMLASVWPGSVSVILPCPDTRWGHIHRGTETVAFRVPDDAELREFLSSSGPIIAPSANPSGLPPATTVEEADAYFHDDADFLVDGGRLSGVPSTVARIVDGKWDVLRRGEVILE